MTNDGWGKLPTNNDGWIRNAEAGPLTPKPDPWAPVTTAWPEIKMAPAWPTATAIKIAEDNGHTVEWPVIQAVDWGATPAQVSGVVELQFDIVADEDVKWTHDALEGASNRAAVINSLRGVKDQYTIDQDGELSNIKETIAKSSDKETGVYIAYSNGKWLHAILSGPYATRNAADLWADVAYEMLTNDPAFKLAFENTFDIRGIYHAEIPLSAKRHGAYGVLS